MHHALFHTSSTTLPHLHTLLQAILFQHQSGHVGTALIDLERRAMGLPFTRRCSEGMGQGSDLQSDSNQSQTRPIWDCRIRLPRNGEGCFGGLGRQSGLAVPETLCPCTITSDSLGTGSPKPSTHGPSLAFGRIFFKAAWKPGLNQKRKICSFQLSMFVPISLSHLYKRLYSNISYKVPVLSISCSPLSASQATARQDGCASGFRRKALVARVGRAVVGGVSA